MYSYEVENVLPEALIDHVAERFRVLGDATRLTILRLLLTRERNVGEICKALPGCSQANISRHLRVLHDAGLVQRRKDGTAVYYRIADETVTSLCEIVCARLKTQAVEHARAFTAQDAG